jgi:hypothetical protein
VGSVDQVMVFESFQAEIEAAAVTHLQREVERRGQQSDRCHSEISDVVLCRFFRVRYEAHDGFLLARFSQFSFADTIPDGTTSRLFQRRWQARA